jgi:hypothetical protein
MRTTVNQILLPISSANMRDAHRLDETGKTRCEIVVEVS